MSESETGDQQAKVSDTEHGWVAGFFDGEGSVVLMVRPSAAKNGGPKVQPMAICGGTDREALDALAGILTRAGHAFHVAWARPNGFAKNGNAYKEAWSLRIVGLRRCERFLTWLLPALVVKRARAVLALRYIAARQAHSDFRTPITPEEWAMAVGMRALNSKTQPWTKAVTLNTAPPGAASEVLSANGRKGAAVRWGSPLLASETER